MLLLGKLILLFTLMPIIELYLLFQIAKVTTPITTLIIVLITGVVGAYLAKSQGKVILTKIKTELNNGRMPGNELINGLCVLIGGALLLTPGLITDIVGFSLVIPGSRNIYKKYLQRKFRYMLEHEDLNFYFRR